MEWCRFVNNLGEKVLVLKRSAIVFPNGVSLYIRGVSGVPWGWVKLLCDGIRLDKLPHLVVATSYYLLATTSYTCLALV